jgi:2-polyprenyl-3-methyl-5-hydroxy-6-metoxy-1,4-benzoquinol methylase
LSYYDENAETFIRDTLSVDMSAVMGRFLENLPDKGRMLDAGCGSGRDIRFFLDKGFQVTAFDASVTMAERASQYSGIEVRHAAFADLNEEEKYDGIWCCASLLHVPKAEFADAIARLNQALKPGGMIYLSFKYGAGERVSNGRYFLDHTEESLAAALRFLPELKIVSMWKTADARPHRKNDFWLNAIARRNIN